MNDTDLESMRAMVTAAIQTMGRSLEEFNRKAKESASPSGGFGNLSTVVVGLTRNLAGPVGLAAGFYAVAESLRKFAAERVSLQMLSTDVGFSTEKISLMKNAMADMGMSAAQTAQVTGTLGAELKQLSTLKIGSPLFEQLTMMGEGEFAKKLLAQVDTGDFNTAMDMIVRKYATMSKEARTYLAVNVLGIPESVLQNYAEFERQTGKSFEGAYQHSADYLRNMNRFKTEVSNIFEELKDKAISFWATDPADRRAGFESYIGLGPKRPELEPQVWDWVKNIGDKTPSMDWLLRLAPHAGGHAGDQEPPLSFKERFQSFSAPGAATATFNERFGTDLLNTESDSNKLLRDMRDSLQHIEMGSERGSGGPGEGGATGWPRTFTGRRGLAERLGINASRSEGGSGGITAPAGTAIQREGLAEVITPDGRKLQVDSRFKDNFQGFINDYYAAGGRFGPSTGTLGVRPGNASGHPIGDAIDVNQIGRGIRSKTGTTLPPDVEDTLAAKWGLVSGNQWRDNDQGHFGIRSTQAARDALVKNGMLPSEADKITGMGAVRGSWFNDRMTASGADASRMAGIALPSREGLGRMFEVTGPDGRKQLLPQIDVGPAGWTGRGVDFSKPAADQLGFDPTDKRFSVRRADGNTEESRASIDRSQSVGSRIDAAMSATVDFKNLPIWVRTSVEQNGAFKNLKITRSTPQMGKAGGGIESSNPWSYE